MNKIKHRKKQFLAIGTILLVLATVSLVAADSDNIIPINLEKRIKNNENPAPYENSKAPMSTIARYGLLNKEELKKIPPYNPIKKSVSAGITPLAPIRFNNEVSNLPQNEQSVTSWTPPSSSATLVVGGANDYRGLYGLLPGASGYYVSNNNGASLLREGALPTLSGLTDDASVSFTALSFGDPALDTYKPDGTTYYASLFIDGFTGTSAVGLGKAKPADLQDTGLIDSQVWKTGKVRADNEFTQFNDKEWVAVDNSGTTTNIYVTWTAFNAAGSKIWMSKCTPSLVCTTVHNDANPVSGSQTVTQWSKVSVDSAGRVVVTWEEYNFTNPNPPYYKINIWYRVFSSGGVAPLTSPVLVKTETKPVDGYSALQSEAFRAPETPWSEVAKNGSTPRLFVAWTACGGSYLFDIPSFLFADTCSNANTYLRYLDNYQTGSPSISPQIALESSSSTHSFFPTLSVNQPANRLDIAWYQSEGTSGGIKHDYYLAQQQRRISNVTNITMPTITTFASAPAEDVYFVPPGGFIGDYFQVRTEPGSTNKVFVHYTGNPTFTLPIPIPLGFGFFLNLGGNQDDNLLYVRTY